ncbi:hypothetical protein ACFV2H_45860 [Streptomyces sp. NPDC059629]|uniref:hypothetical protein n=1 Tax=Streptomyces sp. NPDC059629 TaxID=3346889 RepID=UPI0036A078B2
MNTRWYNSSRRSMVLSGAMIAVLASGGVAAAATLGGTHAAAHSGTHSHPHSVPAALSEVPGASEPQHVKPGHATPLDVPVSVGEGTTVSRPVTGEDDPSDAQLVEVPGQPDSSYSPGVLSTDPDEVSPKVLSPVDEDSVTKSRP